MRDNLSVNNRIIVALTDGHRMTAKEISKEFEAERKPVIMGVLYGGLSKLRKFGYITHVGYARYELTQLGKKQMGKILSGKNPVISEVVNNSELIEENLTPAGHIEGAEVESEPKKLEGKVETETMSWRKGDLIDWEARHLEITNRLLDILEKAVENKQVKGGE